jgi:hypothetical protein
MGLPIRHLYSTQQRRPWLTNLLGFLASLVVIAATIAVSALEAIGNDSMARVGAGGITFIKSEDIRMLEEVLEISPNRINVKYRFLNESDRDIQTVVAFPLPSLPKTKFAEMFGPFPDQFMSSFRVSVDGRSVSTKTDQTNTPYWEQTFPARKETIVEHTYLPFSGGRYEVLYQEGFGHSEDTEERDFLENDSFFDKDPCLDHAARKAIVEQVKTYKSKGVGWVQVMDHDVEYILGTGRNWKGPIGLFRLRIEKDDPRQFISVCFPGTPQQSSSTTYEYVQRDFIPPDEVVVHFYTVMPSPVPDDEKLAKDEQSLNNVLRKPLPKLLRQLTPRARPPSTNHMKMDFSACSAISVVNTLLAMNASISFI